MSPLNYTIEGRIVQTTSTTQLKPGSSAGNSSTGNSTASGAAAASPGSAYVSRSSTSTDTTSTDFISPHLPTARASPSRAACRASVRCRSAPSSSALPSRRPCLSRFSPFVPRESALLCFLFPCRSSSIVRSHASSFATAPAPVPAAFFLCDGTHARARPAFSLARSSCKTSSHLRAA
jgi:hypothetical protein